MNHKTSEKYHLKAINLGHEKAQVELALLYLVERSSRFNLKKGKAMLKKAISKRITTKTAFTKMLREI